LNPYEGINPFKKEGQYRGYFELIESLPVVNYLVSKEGAKMKNRAYGFGDKKRGY